MASRSPSPRVGGFQRPYPIDLVAGCPLLSTADAGQDGTRREYCDQRGDNGYGGGLDVAIGSLESDDDKRHK